MLLSTLVGGKSLILLQLTFLRPTLLHLRVESKGFITGFVGNILADLLSGYGFWLWWDLGNGLLGLIPGLIYPTIESFRASKSIWKAEIFVVLGALAGMGLASLSEMWVSGADINTVIFANFLPAFLSDIINGLILVPLLMIAYAAIVERSGRD